ncbi:MAG: hypothetical protein LBU99_05270 [Spirochaetaceae bacterium]|jgi:hypothetical protein|nr:hypothetical protein [Spirochaetaceae bacterium]
MKKKLFLTGMLSMILAFGLTLAGCGGGPNDLTGDPNNQTPDGTPQNTTEQFTAEAVDGGIKLKVNLAGMPADAYDLRFRNTTVGDIFSRWEYTDDAFEMVYPWTKAGTEYVFQVDIDESATMTNKATLTAKATATGGRGELRFTNASAVNVVNEGNFVKYNALPVLSAFDKTGITSEGYEWGVVEGSSNKYYWGGSFDPSTGVDLTTWNGDASGLMGNACFVEFVYFVSYNGQSFSIAMYSDSFTFPTFD